MSYKYSNSTSFSASAAARRPINTSTNPFDDPAEREPTEQEKIISQILDVQQESKGSTQRSLALLYESSDVGTKTSEQLIEQGEKLDKIQGTVSKIDTDLKTTQKHINGLKSVFGGITNWWQSKGKGKSTKEEPSKFPSDNNGGSLQSFMKKSESEHSTLSSRSASSYRQPAARSGGMMVQTVIEQNEQDIEEDLGQMSALTEQLKYMAQAMGSEIDRQNTQIDDITTRTSNTHTTMSGQNQQMNKILKK